MIGQIVAAILIAKFIIALLEGVAEVTEFIFTSAISLIKKLLFD